MQHENGHEERVAWLEHRSKQTPSQQLRVLRADVQFSRRLANVKNGKQLLKSLWTGAACGFPRVQLIEQDDLFFLKLGILY